MTTDAVKAVAKLVSDRDACAARIVELQRELKQAHERERLLRAELSQRAQREVDAAGSEAPECVRRWRGLRMPEREAVIENLKNCTLVADDDDELAFECLEWLASAPPDDVASVHAESKRDDERLALKARTAMETANARRAERDLATAVALLRRKLAPWSPGEDGWVRDARAFLADHDK